MLINMPPWLRRLLDTFYRIPAWARYGAAGALLMAAAMAFL